MVNTRETRGSLNSSVHTCGRELRSWLIERIVITFAPCDMKILLYVITSSEKNKGEGGGREVERGRRVGRMGNGLRRLALPSDSQFPLASLDNFLN